MENIDTPAALQYSGYMQEPTPKQKTPPALSIYLGPEPLASRRLEELDKLARQLGTSRSKMIQMLADGRLSLTVARNAD